MVQSGLFIKHHCNIAAPMASTPVPAAAEADTRWSSSMETAAHHSKYLRGEYQWLKQEAEDHKKKRVNETDENGEVVQLPTVLQSALNVLDKNACFCICLSPATRVWAIPFTSLLREFRLMWSPKVAEMARGVPLPIAYTPECLN